MNSFDSMNWLGGISTTAKILIFYLDHEYHVCVGVKTYKGASLAEAIEVASIDNPA